MISSKEANAQASSCSHCMSSEPLMDWLSGAPTLRDTYLAAAPTPFKYQQLPIASPCDPIIQLSLHHILSPSSPI